MDVNLFKGNLDLILLSVLEREGGYGQDIAKRVDALTEGQITLNAGSLYPALHRMEESGWIKAEWSKNENGRQARMYKLTSSGRKQLAAEETRWDAVSAAINRVLRTV